MAKDHYLPAGFIGRFSSDATGAYRDRKLWTYNVKARKTLNTAASAIGYKKGLYNLHDGRTVDKWDYEGPLNRVLDDIANSKDVTLDDWVHIAVPFITGLFVRGKEFNERYENMPMMKEFMKSGMVNPDNTNGSRIMRLQRQLSPVIAARWVVLHNSDPTTPMISNDLGLVLTQDSNNGAVGWAIPLDPQTVLGIFPQKVRRIARYNGSTWYANIEHLRPSAGMFKGMNEQVARASREFIFGADESSMETNKQYTGVEVEEKMSVIMEGPWAQMFSGKELVAHEAEWQIVAGLANLNLSPDEIPKHEFSLEDLNLQNKWSPPIVLFPANLTPFPSGVGIRGNDMVLALELLDDFESHIIRPPDPSRKLKSRTKISSESSETVMEPGQFLKCPALMVVIGQLRNVFKKLIEPYRGLGWFEPSSLNFQVII